MYAQMIREALARQGFVGTDAQQVECWMRLEHGTLDGLSRRQFDREVVACAQMVRDFPVESAELVETY